jgi:hypothetical protein
VDRRPGKEKSGKKFKKYILVSMVQLKSSIVIFLVTSFHIYCLALDDHFEALSLSQFHIHLVFNESVSAAERWRKSPGKFPVYDSDEEEESGRAKAAASESDDSDSDSSSSASSPPRCPVKSRGSQPSTPKKEQNLGKKESQGSPKKRKRDDGDSAGDVEQPPQKRQRLYGNVLSS